MCRAAPLKCNRVNVEGTDGRNSSDLDTRACKCWCDDKIASHHFLVLPGKVCKARSNAAQGLFTLYLMCNVKGSLHYFWTCSYLILRTYLVRTNFVNKNMSTFTGTHGVK